MAGQERDRDTAGRETMHGEARGAGRGDSEPLEIRRKRLRFRSWHRGTREMDLLVGQFADAHLQDFGAEQLERFEALLLEADPDLYNWMIGAAEPPPELDHDVMKLIRSFKYQP